MVCYSLPKHMDFRKALRKFCERRFRFDRLGPKLCIGIPFLGACGALQVMNRKRKAIARRFLNGNELGAHAWDWY